MATRVSLVGVPGAISDIMRDVSQEAPAILTIFAEEALKEIRPRWPVRTGKSLQALDVVPDGDGVAIVCDVPHVSYIHLKGEKGPMYLTHIVEYVAQNLDRIAAKTSARLRRTA